MNFILQLNSYKYSIQFNIHIYYFFKINAYFILKQKLKIILYLLIFSSLNLINKLFFYGSE